jgi:indole-3-glycerol phosphate synthase
MATILDTIVDSVRKQIHADKTRVSPGLMYERALQVDKTVQNGFESALKHQGIAVIAEVKKASPSKGVICKDFDPVAIARDYDQGGANAISVLTEPQFFQGHPDYLQQIRQQGSRPLLRKDFIIDTYQIDQTVVLGASAVLFIAAILDDHQLFDLLNHCKLHNLQALVEVHNKAELLRVLDSPARIIGINNRDLQTFDVSLQTSLDLVSLLPATHTSVSESGIFTRQDVQTLEQAGFDAILVGESLMRQQNRIQALKELRGDLCG